MQSCSVSLSRLEQRFVPSDTDGVYTHTMISTGKGSGVEDRVAAGRSQGQGLWQEEDCAEKGRRQHDHGQR